MTEYVVTRWYRAPELLCESETYGPAVDVWSVGCIFAELMLRRPLFKGDSTRRQLELILQTLGSPNEDELRGITSHAALRIIRSMAQFPRASTSDRFGL